MLEVARGRLSKAERKTGTMANRVRELLGTSWRVAGEKAPKNGFVFILALGYVSQLRT